MTAQATTSNSKILRQEVLGSRRFSNYFWAVISTIGGVGFLLAGLSSYLGVNLLLVSDPSELQFIPQGIALTFYGFAGTAMALYLYTVIFLNVGGGYNEFNRETGEVTIFRWGFFGKNRRIELKLNLEDVQAVRAEIKEGLNPKRSLYLRAKKRRDIPLTRVGEPLSLSELENQGAELARFLSVPLEGL
ncbi:photosystem I assembly protein Ycf4 [Oscillatoria salina]|uniref:photosystem I assembly protein Ycf4 n=1 Tax=Oscillatoria salina TaxID=331517 RepID=UPI0013B9E1DD|nr:photosystem I assembly protein Ycf4 [Oscillatoria salina]MBZ8179337.1 photosystem I assembly protein Ycf4 [Oscillatoria salina IIICB1]NET87629.1 photosystem I assembly protein Ycf4 [Kamptonema sp. SIO1D9]